MRLALAILLCSSSASASIGGELASPWTTAARASLLTGAAATSALFLFKYEIVEPIQTEVNQSKPLGKISGVGYYSGLLIPNALYASLMGLTGYLSDSPIHSQWALIMVKASAYAVGTSFAIKLAVRETRPDGSDRQSFPSGHSTAIFAFASVVTAEHGLWPYGIAANALAAFTAFSRMNDNKHWLHDVMAGATVGTAYGLGISYYTRKQSSAEFSSRLTPVVSGNFAGVVWLRTFD